MAAANGLAVVARRRRRRAGRRRRSPAASTWSDPASPAVAWPDPADLVDPFGRTVRDLRISVTDRCNFRCTYCMPDEGMKWLPRAELLTFEEIERIARLFVERFGVDGDPPDRWRADRAGPPRRCSWRSWPRCADRRRQAVDLAITTNGATLRPARRTSCGAPGSTG